MSRVRGIARVATLCALLGCGAAQARVFLATPGSHGPASAGQPGWNRVYEADVRINGGAGRMEVLGVDHSSRDTRTVLEQAYRRAGLQVFLLGPDALAWGAAFDTDRVIRLLVIATGAERACLVFRLEQSRDDFLRSVARPTEHRLRAVPPLAGSFPRLFAADDRAGTEVEISETNQSPGQAATELHLRMLADGWAALTPHDARAGVPPGLLYARGDRLALVQAAVGTSGRTTVTRLVKRQHAASDIATRADLR